MDITTYMEEFEIRPDAHVDVRGPSVNGPDITAHKHVVIEWEGGSIWLDMSTFNDHNCIDIRQMNEDGLLKGQGYFTIVDGQRGHQALPLQDDEGTEVTGHGWNGGYVMTLLTDVTGSEAAVRAPADGTG